MSRRHILIPDSLASVFTRLEELVLANSGEDELEEIFKLLLAKLWAEKSGGADRFQVHGSPALTFEALSELLAAAARSWEGLLAPGEGFRLSPEHLEACVHTLVGVELLASGGEALDATFEFLTARGRKGVKGQFFTPRHAVDLCVRMVRPRPSETVLDPACGSGAFLLHALAQLREAGELRSEAEVARYAEERLWGFDFDPRAIRIARALLRVAGDGRANLVRLNSLIKREGARGGSSEPTLEQVLRARGGPTSGFDVVLTNPPFAGEIRERELLDGYALGAGRARVERDVLFLERCVELLRPGGRLCIVLPHSKLAAESFAPVREWLLERVRLVAVIGLGRNTFMPHTSQKASVVFGIRRAREGCSLEETIFFGVSEREGKDARGLPIFRGGAGDGRSWRELDHDLGELLLGFDERRRAEAEEG